MDQDPFWSQRPRTEHLVSPDLARRIVLADSGAVEATLKLDEFLMACRTAGIGPTRRQALKWLRKRGKAWRAVHGVQLQEAFQASQEGQGASQMPEGLVPHG